MALSFMKPWKKESRYGPLEIYPKFIVNYRKNTDLMVRGGDFYAIWDEERGMWSTLEQDVIDLVDDELEKYVEEHKNDPDFARGYRIQYMWDGDNKMINKFHSYCHDQLREHYSQLDETIIFSNTPTKRENYASKRLSYPLESGSIENYDKLMSVLYSPEERHKLEWAIGAIVTGDAKHIQKFLVLYGSAGTGKSTILNIIQKMFEGYCAVFDAKALGSATNSFALEPFKNNPLVAIQHDGDLSRIEDNTRLNSIVSHEDMTVNEKFKSAYTNRFKCMLLMGTNKPVRITDAKSGLLRRLIDVTPTGNKIPAKDYRRIIKGIDFELGAIASHCKEVYLAEPDAYDDYVPINMMGASNDFYNYVLDSYLIFKADDATTLKSAWEMYKTYCEDAKVPYPYSQRLFKEELKNYFREYNDRDISADGTRVRSYYKGFRTDKFEADLQNSTDISTEVPLIDFGAYPSEFDALCASCPAQYASSHETPNSKWESVTTTLADIETKKLHYVRVPENHIVIDFDIPGEDGKKDFRRNLEAASKWPATYAELSKSGAGIHLHYIYAGDPTKLSRVYDDHIEIKVYTGNSSLRRKLTKCNNLPVATLTSGLPIKEDKVIDFDGIKDEEHLRNLISKAMRREIKGMEHTKPAIDFIFKTLEDAYKSGMVYDVSNMINKVMIFANGSSHQSQYCLSLVAKMKFKSEEEHKAVNIGEKPIVFYDVEVFPNLFIICWKIQGKDYPVHRMINPTRAEIETLFNYRLVGFNNRKYDNHIVYGAWTGMTPYELFCLSKSIIQNKTGFFGAAYNLSYTDIYDFAAKKQSLKKWEIELGIHHHELGLPWDQPVPEERWQEVAEYCDDDVLATEATFEHLAGDWTARLILADIAGMTPNDTTNSLTTKIIFGNNKHPQLVYTHLEETFPGYSFENGHNMYRGTDLGFGGYVYSEPGMYKNVALIDIQSLHPNSIRAMNCFGEYTKNFTDILDTRVFIKHKDYESAKKLFGGKLERYLNDPKQAKALSQALKIAINSVYGLTSATFENPFRDPRNKNNIVALRGALFMRTLQDEVVARGYKVAHIKTDSIKIPDASPEIVKFCMDFAAQYGYIFEHEATYEKMCLVNNAVYIAKYSSKEYCQNTYGYIPDKNEGHAGQWTATGTQFQIPYVFKTLFSKEPIVFEDMCETKSVNDYLYLDFNEGLAPGERKLQFVGKVGLFCPVLPGTGGGDLVVQREKKDGTIAYDNANGAKGYRWLEAETVAATGKYDCIDKSYYTKLVDKAVDDISKFGNFEWLVSEEVDFPLDDDLPWYI